MLKYFNFSDRFFEYFRKLKMTLLLQIQISGLFWIRKKIKNFSFDSIYFLMMTSAYPFMETQKKMSLNFELSHKLI